MHSEAHHQLLATVRQYSMPDEAASLLTAHQPLIVAGVTAAGKDTILKYIEESTNWRHVITHTTRQPRAGELNGKNYWFVSEEEMLTLLQGNAMIETKAVHGNAIYGTSIEAYKKVLALNQKPMLRIDIQGILELTNHLPRLQAAFILPPSFETWMERLDKRGQMSHIEKTQRLKSAQVELREALKSRHFVFVVNDEVPRTSQELLKGVTDGAAQHRHRELANQLTEHISHY